MNSGSFLPFFLVCLLSLYTTCIDDLLRMLGCLNLFRSTAKASWTRLQVYSRKLLQYLSFLFYFCMLKSFLFRSIIPIYWLSANEMYVQISIQTLCQRTYIKGIMTYRDTYIIQQHKKL
jgi:hypothetical protein